MAEIAQSMVKDVLDAFVNRNSPILAGAAKKAAENYGLNVKTFSLTSSKPYEHFPNKLSTLLRQETPKAGMSLFDYSHHPDWNLREVGARIELLHQTIEQIPISWAHSPGITLDMALKRSPAMRLQKNG
jgi:hypothetical protein